jgi:hypothetical protein
MNTPPTDGTSDRTSDRADDTGWYLIRVKGHLAPRWATRFEPMTLTPQDDGSTLLQGLVADQAALHGLLQQIRDLGLPLVSVTRAEARPPPAAETSPPTPTQSRPHHHQEKS